MDRFENSLVDIKFINASRFLKILFHLSQLKSIYNNFDFCFKKCILNVILS